MNKSNEPGSYVFDIKEKIATGSFGTSIFKAYDATLGQVAIAKKFPAHSINNHPRFEKLLDEVKLLNSPHIVRLYGYYKASKNFWVVMEYCHGHSVYDLMERLGRPLSEKQIRTTLHHTLRGLEHLHSRQIVHTRVKACNILVTTAGQCKLSEPSLPLPISDAGIDMNGVVGNSYWTAPEVLQEEPYSTSADIWSLGITIIEMAERQPPYAETHPSRVMVTIPKRPPPQPLNPADWNKYLKIVLNSCLQKTPGSRETAPELLAHKYIKKAEMKGMQTLVHKSMKLAQNNKFQNTPNTAWPPVKEKQVDDESNWAESGTLVWASPLLPRNRASTGTVDSPPAKPPLTSKLSAPANITSTRTGADGNRGDANGNRGDANTGSIPPVQSDTSSADIFAECDSDTMKPSSFAKYKAINNRQSSDGDLVGQDPKTPLARLSKTSEKIKAEVTPKYSNSSERQKRSPQVKRTDSRPGSKPRSTSSDAPKPRSTSSDGPKTTQNNTPSPSATPQSQQTKPPQQQQTKPERSANYNIHHSPGPDPNKRPKTRTPSLAEVKSSPLGALYDTSTITLKMATDYTPSYMDIYKDSKPPLVEEEVQPTPNIMRRNSIDRRGLELDRMQEELRQELDKVDYEYCKELEELKFRYIRTFETIKQIVRERSQKAEGKLDFYDKLQKSELVVMLGYIKKRHVDRVTATKEHFDLQHKFLMDALKKAKNHDDETQFNLKISENNEEKAHSLLEWDRLFQQENQAILKAMEKIDYANAIAHE